MNFNHITSYTDIKPLLQPGSVAIIGYSENPITWGNRLASNLKKGNYTGSVYYVNPKFSMYPNLNCYPSVKSIEKAIDLALITVPPNAIGSVMTELNDCQTKWGILFTAGFAESESTEGVQNNTVLKQHLGNMRLLGPNCLGVINVKGSLWASVSQLLQTDTLLPGNVAIVSQSGAFGNILVRMLQDRGIGLRYFLSTGNEIDVDLTELGLALLHDPEVHILGTYVETIRNFDRFKQLIDVAHHMGKSIVILKAGRSDAGQRATLSHTAALSGNDEVFRALCRWWGVFVAENDEEFVTAIQVANAGLVGHPFRSLGIVTMSGGAGALWADALSEIDVSVPLFSQRTIDALEPLVHEYGTLSNPVDLSGMFSRHMNELPNVIEVVSKDDKVEGTGIFISFADSIRDTLLPVIHQTSLQTSKPVFWVLGGTSSKLISESSEYSLVFDSLHHVEMALRIVNEWPQFQFFSKDISINAHRIEEFNRLFENVKKNILTESDSFQVLQKLGIPYSLTIVLRAEDVLTRNLIPDNSGPWVIKLDSPYVTHRAKRGWVITNVPSFEDLLIHWGWLRREAINHLLPEWKIIIQSFIQDKKSEFIVGGGRDRICGPYVLFGFGGVAVESLKKSTIVVPAPISLQEASTIVTRYEKKMDICEQLSLILHLISQIVACHHRLQSIDLNPVLVTTDGKVLAVDSLILLDESISK